jgi:hypothetical protein
VDVWYAIAPSLFLGTFMLPAAIKSLGVTADQLTVQAPTEPNQQNNCSIVNNGNISLPAVEHLSTHYYPQLTTYTIKISGNQIVTTGAGQFDITGLSGAYVTFENLEIVGQISYDSGQRAVIYQQVSSTPPTTESHIPWYEQLLDVSIIANLILTAVIAAVEDAATNALQSTGAISGGNFAMDTASWAGLAGFTVSGASLAPALVLQGNTSANS